MEGGGGILNYSSLIFPQLSQLVVNSGGVAAVVDYIGETKGNIRLPGIMMLGYVAAHSEVLAMSVIVSKVKRCHQFDRYHNSTCIVLRNLTKLPILRYLDIYIYYGVSVPSLLRVYTMHGKK